MSLFATSPNNVYLYGFYTRASVHSALFSRNIRYTQTLYEMPEGTKEMKKYKMGIQNKNNQKVNKSVKV